MFIYVKLRFSDDFSKNTSYVMTKYITTLGIAAKLCLVVCKFEQIN